MMKFLNIAIILLMYSHSAASADSVRKYAILNVASYHVNASTKFNERNMGLSLGLSQTDKSFGSWNYGIEVGFYNNSFDQISSYATVNSDIAVAQINAHTELRIGAFVGLFEYPTMTGYAEQAGIPTIGGFVLVPGITTTARIENGVDIRIRLAPAAKRADAIFTLQLGIEF